MLQECLLEARALEVPPGVLFGAIRWAPENGVLPKSDF